MTSQPDNISSARKVTLTVLLGIFIFGPTTVRYLVDPTSFAAGLAASSLLIWSLSFAGALSKPTETSTRYNWAVALCCGLIAVHIVLTHLLGEPDLERPFTSLLLLATLLLTSRYIGHVFFASDNDHRFALYIMLLLFALIAIFGILGIAPPGSGLFERPLFPFTEPSHLAFTIMPVLLYAVVTTSRTVRLIILAVTAAAAVLLKSLSLVVGLILAGACSLEGLALVSFLLAALATIQLLNLRYFTDRLDFAYGNDNLSMLVYRQGVELIQKSLAETTGWGIGFQRLGFTDLYTTSSNIIYALVHMDLNLRDGGFTAAKLIAEFGIVGLVITIIYLVLLARCTLLLRQLATRQVSLPSGVVFALSCFVGFSIEMFVRGAGYFTPTALLAIAALPYIRTRYWKKLAYVAV
jgi:hypothetical protein